MVDVFRGVGSSGVAGGAPPIRAFLFLCRWFFLLRILFPPLMPSGVLIPSKKFATKFIASLSGLDII